MTQATPPRPRRVWMGAIALLSLLVLTVAIAPNNAQLLQGSSYSRAPDGYGAWYAALAQQGLPVNRWQRPLEALVPTLPNESTPAPPPQSSTPSDPITLVRVFPSPIPPDALDLAQESLAQAGSVILLLGIQTPVSAAPFSSQLESAAGPVIVETRRRAPTSSPSDPSDDPNNDAELIQQSLPAGIRPLLQDEFGIVAWERPLGQGKLIYINTPHLAANAYQDAPGNFAWLTQQVVAPGHPIWVDEYLHGYRDPEVLQEEARGTLWGYLWQTPLALVFIQAGVWLLLAVWGDRRLGPPVLPRPTPPNSSLAYIQALGGVLEKAGSSEFVQDLLSQAEQAHLQRTLGLGTDNTDPKMVLDVWQAQTNVPKTTLQPWLAALYQQQKKRLPERDLLIWLGKLQTIRHHLPNFSRSPRS